MRPKGGGGWLLAVAALAIRWPFAFSPVQAQAIVIAEGSAQSLTGAPEVRVEGLEAGAEVDLIYVRAPPDGLPPAYSSKASFRAGQDGVVSGSTVPLRGDWTLPVPEAPFWSMKPDDSAPLPPQGIVLIQARSQTVRAEVAYRLPEPAAVVVETIDAFTGAFLVRPATPTGPLPLVIVLGGSEGDDRTARRVAPRLAAQGYAALGLPYLSPDRGRGQALPGLPSAFTQIPVDRLGKVYQWAGGDPRIDPSRIGVWGQSKGAEFALIAAAHYPWVDAVVAVVPSDVVWEGFSYGSVARTGTASFSLGGRPLSFVPYGGSGRTTPEKLAGRRDHPARAASARIPVEQFAGPLLVAGGEADSVWDSGGMSQAIAERRAESGRATTSLVFAEAGHALAADPLSPGDDERGGTAEANGQARLAIWAATLVLFRAAWASDSGEK